MKKIRVLLLCVCSVFAFSACSDAKTNSFISLKDDQTLFIGSDKMLKNHQDTLVTDKYLTYEKDVTYTLYRSSNFVNNDSVYYQGYYYYWSTNIVREEEYLGKEEVNTIYNVSYLPYGEDDQNLVVKITAKRITSYNYEGGYIEKSRNCVVNLNSYFNSFEDLKTKCNDIAVKIDNSNSKKYYVDVTVPNETEAYQQEFISTYFYIE